MLMYSTSTLTLKIKSKDKNTMNEALNHPVTPLQEVIEELRQEATTSEDQAYLAELQREHDEGRARLGLAPDPALQQMGATATGKEYHVGADGAVHIGERPSPEDHPYNKGRRS